MKRWYLLISAVIFSLLFASSLSAQEIYKWKDEKGQWRFSQTPPIGRQIERLDLPTQEGRDLKTRSEWQNFYAPFRETKYKMNRPNPHTAGLKGLVALSQICEVHESLSSILLAAREQEKATERRESARLCAQEAQVTFPILFERAQKELSQAKPSALEKLRAFALAWLTAIRKIPRVERVDLLQRMQEEDRKIIGQKESDLDIELL